MNILVLGSGGREHSILRKLREENNNINQLYCIPGNAGTATISKNVDISLYDYPSILQFAIENKIKLTIVGPEGPLAGGIVDYFQENNQRIFGPNKSAAMLECSKLYARDLMKKFEIPHPHYFSCSEKREIEVAKELLGGLPVVIKNDGLAAGKGVFVCHTENEYSNALVQLFTESECKKISVEECLQGPEISVFIACNNKNYIILNNAQDYKRAFNGNIGPNTGGMGAFAPTPLYNSFLDEKVRKRIIEPTLQAIESEGMSYCGFLYFGLMIVQNEPYVIEYNVRLGDPETQVILPLMKSSFLHLINSTLDNTLDNYEYKVKPGFSTTVVITSDGYPYTHKIGRKIYGSTNDDAIFHSGTKLINGTTFTSGGRVLSSVGYGHSLKQSAQNAYAAIQKIYFHNMFYRTDIGNISQPKKTYEGKVRHVEYLGDDLLVLIATDKLSAFNRHICNIPNKGRSLNEMSEWWFNKTKHIIDNHFLFCYNDYMIVKKADPIKLEFVVRGYITGSTNTSLWSMYEQGYRQMYGINFREGYKKNDKLDDTVLTPTTKDQDDKPISREQIIEEGYLTVDEYNFIEKKSKELFHYGQRISSLRGLTLVDTKYEFGKLPNGQIILIDELHTCDSSRYWIGSTFNKEPLKMDKDVIRDWIKERCNPYTDVIPEVPQSLIDTVATVYQKYKKHFY